MLGRLHIDLPKADLATGSIACCSCWKLVSPLRRLLDGYAPVSPLGRLLVVLPGVGLAARAVSLRFVGNRPRCYGGCSCLP
ncbi:hypothetical protein CDL15_Pgr016528 [Punica granatum]|uniref:Uncharacterized protein n=1 Tax=Punica granatum TaxID=22663 RepID=A0A218WJS3_PUNGR|nr:hypothetical protein CDL15_Pgr016528 [Punica granatum]